MNSDSYYDPQDDKGDAIAWLTDSINEYWIEEYPCEPGLYAGEPFEKESSMLESIALAIMDDADLYDRVVSNLKWIAAGRPKATNVYEENADLYDADLDYERHCLEGR